jgi:hypothetical protein
MDSFRHLDDKVPANDVEGLNEALQQKADSQALVNHKEDINAHSTLFSKKVDKVLGKGLSTNDYSTEEKNKLAALPQNDDLVTTLATKLDKGAYNGDAQSLKEEIDNINLLLSSDDLTLDQLQEVVDFIKLNKSELDSLGISNILGLQTALDNKVDKVLGKGLSTNDFTNALLDMLNSAVQPIQSPVLDADYVLRNNTWVSTLISPYPKIFISELIPDSYQPSSTGNVEVFGNAFTKDMCLNENLNHTEQELINGAIGFTIEGQIINYATFINDNKITLNVTRGAAEGSFAIMGNNGSGFVKKLNAVLVILGTVFKPIENEWTDKSVSLDVSKEGTTKITVYNSFVYGIWNHLLDYTKNISIRFSPEVSPLGDMQGVLRAKQFSLIRVSDGVELFSSNTIGAGTNAIRDYWYSISDGFQFQEVTNGISYIDSFIELATKSIYEFRLINGTMYFYKDNVLLHTFTDSITENLKIKVYIKNYDYKGIKYIELT